MADPWGEVAASLKEVARRNAQFTAVERKQSRRKKARQQQKASRKVNRP